MLTPLMVTMISPMKMRTQQVDVSDTEIKARLRVASGYTHIGGRWPIHNELFGLRILFVQHSVSVVHLRSDQHSQQHCPPAPFAQTCTSPLQWCFSPGCRRSAEQKMQEQLLFNNIV